MAYTVTQATKGKTGGGPRVNFGTDSDNTRYLIVGAYDNVNNIDNVGGRPLVIKGLPDAPAGADLSHLVIDKKTGQLYVAP
jgi:hypothetical protein